MSKKKDEGIIIPPPQKVIGSRVAEIHAKRFRREEKVQLAKDNASDVEQAVNAKGEKI